MVASASFQRPSDAEMMLGGDFSGEDEPVAVQQPRRYFVKSLVGAAVLGGFAFCGLRTFASSEQEEVGSVYYGDHRIQLAEDADPKVKVVGGLMGAWGKGVFHGDACEESAKKYFTDDVATDATAPTLHTDMYKKYEKITGVCEWIKNLEAFNFTTFKIEEMYPDGDDKVIAQVTYTPQLVTGETAPTATEDGQIWTLTDGKISSVKFLFAGILQVDALFQQKKLEHTSAVGVINRMFMMWGQGKFHGDVCKDNSKAVVSDDFSMMKFGPMTGDAHGIDGWCNAAATMEKYKLSDMQPPVMMERGSDEVLMLFKLKLNGKPLHEQHLWTVKDGKVLKHEWVTSDVKAYV